MVCYYSILLAASLLCLTSSTVYYVMPDDHYHPINDNTYTLQHYLNNTNKYFTSNTQLHFLPGQYYLNNDVIIQDVTNFSLIGNRTNEIINTVISYTSPAGITIIKGSNITVANVAMNDCGNDYLNDYLFESKIVPLASLLLLQCRLITCNYLYTNNADSIEFINPMLNKKLSNLIINHLIIWNNKLS